ncbi:MAG: TonB-dependent receptor plug domain-containing protein, partial [Acetobacter cibinongensis]
MSQTDRLKQRMPLSFKLLYALPVFAAGVPAIADAATTASTSASHAHAAPAKAAAKKHTGRVVTRPATVAPAVAAPVAATPVSNTVANRTIRQARAAQTAEGGTEAVTVTGSFLRQGRNTSPNPVQIISAKDIQQTGVTNVGDFLQRMPSIGSSG